MVHRSVRVTRAGLIMLVIGLLLYGGIDLVTSFAFVAKALPSSNVRFVQGPGDQLSVLVPPLYDLGLGLFFAGALAFVLAFAAKNAPLSMRLPLWLVCLGAWLAAFYMSTSSILMVLSRNHDTLSITHRGLGLEISSQVYPLHDVAGFGLYTSRSSKGSETSYDISVLLNSGREFGLEGATTNRGGYQSAVDALNDFLGE